MNAKIYLVKGKYISVEGDVWGNLAKISHKGFKVGDKVVWKNKRNIIQKIMGKKEYLTGTITTVKDDLSCLIKVDSSLKIVDLPYEKINKSGN